MSCEKEQLITKFVCGRPLTVKAVYLCGFIDTTEEQTQATQRYSLDSETEQLLGIYTKRQKVS